MIDDKEMDRLEKACGEFKIATFTKPSRDIPSCEIVDPKVGEPLVRWLAFKIPMMMRITKVDADTITCQADGGPDGYYFDRLTGMEIDPDLEWGPAHSRSGSYVMRPTPWYPPEREGKC